jgi:hypothetical protein
MEDNFIRDDEMMKALIFEWKMGSEAIRFIVREGG